MFAANVASSLRTAKHLPPERGCLIAHRSAIVIPPNGEAAAVSLLAIEHLGVRYPGKAAVQDASLRIAAGEIVALVGSSGSGKSSLALAIPALLPDEAIVDGSVLLEGRRVVRADRGSRIGMVFQDPATALNPALTIRRQIGEAIGRGHDRAAVASLLARVGLDVPPARYPHMLSGGQRQRVAIAIGIAGRPSLLIADEPTAALDPESRAQIAALLRGLAREQGMALLLVTHDLDLARSTADRIAVLNEGRLVEEGGPSILTAPESPALRDLVAATHLPPASSPSAGAPLLEIDRVTRRYRATWRSTEMIGLADASLTLHEGETLGLIGPSGAGKSTLARLALGLDRADAGSVRLGGIDPAAARGAALAQVRHLAQAVFQDPVTSFDPRWRVERIVADPLRLEPGTPDRAARVAAALRAVELDPALASANPRALSGGQRQRVAIARALILQPRLVVLDEALSALDLATRAGVVALLRRLQQERGLAYLLIGHDLAVIRALAHRVAVLREGAIVAQGPTDAIVGSAEQHVGRQLP